MRGFSSAMRRSPSLGDHLHATGSGVADSSALAAAALRRNIAGDGSGGGGGLGRGKRNTMPVFVLQAMTVIDRNLDDDQIFAELPDDDAAATAMPNRAIIERLGTLSDMVHWVTKCGIDTLSARECSLLLCRYLSVTRAAVFPLNVIDALIDIACLSPVEPSFQRITLASLLCSLPTGAKSFVFRLFSLLNRYVSYCVDFGRKQGDVVKSGDDDGNSVCRTASATVMSMSPAPPRPARSPLAASQQDSAEEVASASAALSAATSISLPDIADVLMNDRARARLAQLADRFGPLVLGPMDVTYSGHKIVRIMSQYFGSVKRTDAPRDPSIRFHRYSANNLWVRAASEQRLVDMLFDVHYWDKDYAKVLFKLHRYFISAPQLLERMARWYYAGADVDAHPCLENMRARFKALLRQWIDVERDMLAKDAQFCRGLDALRDLANLDGIETPGGGRAAAASSAPAAATGTDTLAEAEAEAAAALAAAAASTGGSSQRKLDKARKKAAKRARKAEKAQAKVQKRLKRTTSGAMVRGGGGGGGSASPLGPGGAAKAPRKSKVPKVKSIRTDDDDEIETPLASLRAHQLGAALTAIDNSLFRALPPSELTGKSFLKGQEQAPNYVAMTKAFNRWSNWACAEVVARAVLSERVDALAKLIHVAHVCRLYNNFNTCYAIVAGLQLSPVARLKLTWERLPRKTQIIWDELCAVFDIDDNHRAYREALNVAHPPIIPYIGLYGKTLLSMEDNPHDPIRTKEGLVSFNKLRMIYALIKEIQQYQLVPYHELPEDADLQRYFRSEFELQSESELFDQSLVCEPRASSSSRRTTSMASASLSSATAAAAADSNGSGGGGGGGGSDTSVATSASASGRTIHNKRSTSSTALRSFVRKDHDKKM
jgi:RasGEF domain